MSIISALFDSKIYNFQQAFGVKDITSAAMKAAIRDWYGLYYMDRPTEQEDPCQRLPVAVVSKLTRTAFSEYSAQAVGDTAKTAFLGSILGGLDRVRKRAMQQALIGGECFLKPIPAGGRMHFGVVGRSNFLVLARNDLDEITGIGTAERTEHGGKYYTLLERRTVDTGGWLTIESRLYCSSAAGIPGTEVPLGTLPQYAALRPVNTLTVPVGSLGLIPLRVPIENCVDGSADGVAVYAAAAGLIHNINTNEAQLNGEFQRGESRILLSGDMMEVGADGKRQPLRDHVFTALDESPDDMGVNIFSPAFREQSFLARKAEYLRNVESLIGLKRGILSEVEAAERTATEVTSSAGDYNLTILDFQQMWETAAREAVRACGILGQMYKLYSGPALDPEKDVTMDWGNGILYDRDKAWVERKEQMAAGMLKPELALAWYYNLPHDTPEDLEKIRTDYMPELRELVGE